jgi:hypothetical protein
MLVYLYSWTAAIDRVIFISTLPSLVPSNIQNKENGYTNNMRYKGAENMIAALHG